MQCSTRDVGPPLAGAGRKAFITGVTQIDGKIVQILDIEKVLHELAPVVIEELDEHLLSERQRALLKGRRVLVVDDSHVALQQTTITLRKLQLDCQMVRSAAAALELLQAQYAAGQPIEVLVSDIEMPEMDGYDLVRTVRKLPDIGQTYVLLHTSLDSTMNTEKAEAVGANAVLTKFSTVDLSKALVHAFESLQ